MDVSDDRVVLMVPQPGILEQAITKMRRVWTTGSWGTATLAVSMYKFCMISSLSGRDLI